MNANNLNHEGNLVERFRHSLEARGMKGRLVFIRRLADLEGAWKKHLSPGNYSEQFIRDYLEYPQFSLPPELPEAKTIVVTATPSPQTKVIFHWEGQAYRLLLPPTYGDYRRVREKVEAVLGESFGAAGYRFVRAVLPVKRLAVHSGLAEYGRNNITYVEGMGSFVRLSAYYTDYAADTETWAEVRMMNACQTCSACQKACPTGAIRDDRFLLQADRCLTYMNEFGRDFPDWLDPRHHNALYGCMHCQWKCPQNRAVVGWFEERCEFSEIETALILKGASLAEMPKETQEKFDNLEWAEGMDTLPRNLRVLLQKEAVPGGV